MISLTRKEKRNCQGFTEKNIIDMQSPAYQDILGFKSLLKDLNVIGNPANSRMCLAMYNFILLSTLLYKVYINPTISNRHHQIKQSLSSILFLCLNSYMVSESFIGKLL
jgi:hypothetical protein